MVNNVRFNVSLTVSSYDMSLEDENLEQKKKTSAAQIRYNYCHRYCKGAVFGPNIEINPKP